MGVGETASTITFTGFLFAAVMTALLVFLPRRLALLPIIFTVCYMTIGQQVVVANLHFSIIRILILFGWVRVVIRNEWMGFRWNSIDKLLVAWQLSRVAMNTLQHGTIDAFVGISGYAYDAVGVYFLLRFLIRGLDEIPQIVKLISLAVIPLAILMLIERSTTTNLFSVFGGVLDQTMVDEEGRLRCQGPFRHPILAGTFGAAILPLFLGLRLHDPHSRRIAYAGIIAVPVIVLTAHSSGPVVASTLVVVAMVLWRFRLSMRAFRWTGLVGLIALHIMMNDPVWALYGRLSEVMGGTGYHRTALMTAAVSHFDEWWLMGTHYTAHWMPYTLRLDPTMADMTNQFIYEGVVGGLLTLLLFIFLISCSFGAVGSLIRHTESRWPFSARILVWSLGVALLAHVVSFLSVSYFDQNVVMFCFILACIALCKDRLLQGEEHLTLAGWTGEGEVTEIPKGPTILRERRTLDLQQGERSQAGV